MNKEELIKTTLEEIAKEKKIRRVDVSSYDLANRLAEKLVNKTNDIHSVMLSETLEEAEKRATEIDDGKSHYSLAHSQGFESGAEWVIDKIKEKLHSA